MGLRMKNFNISGFDWKIRLLGRGCGVMKNQYRWGDFLKRGAWTVCRFTGWCFWWGVDTSMHTMKIRCDLVWCVCQCWGKYHSLWPQSFNFSVCISHTSLFIIKKSDIFGAEKWSHKDGNIFYATLRNSLFSC